MTNEKNFANEIISDAELDMVSGSTCAELHEVVQAYSGNKKLMAFLTGMTEIACNAIPPGNVLLASAAEGALQKLGINAHISVGWLGSGVRSVGNTYKTLDGKSLSHGEVVDMLNKWSSTRK